MDVKKQYEEQMKLFFETHQAVRDLVYTIFKPSKTAQLDDLYDARLLLEKTQEVKAHLDAVLASKNLKLRDHDITKKIVI